MSTVAKKKGLGRGLEVLLGTSHLNHLDLDAEEMSLSTVLLDQLEPGAYQPRVHMDDDALEELAMSIRAQGIIQPIVVREIEQERYEIIAGERRFRAAKLAGLDRVPVLIKSISDKAAAAVALIENIQRENLNPLEEAQGIQRLLTEFQLTHDQVAQAVGRSRSAVSNLLRLLNLAPPVQTLLMAGELDMGHARALLGLTEHTQIDLAQKVASRKASVRDAEKWAAAALKADAQQAMQGSVDASVQEHDKKEAQRQDIAGFEEALSDALMAKVSIKVGIRRQGHIAIDFGSLEALEGLVARLLNKEG